MPQFTVSGAFWRLLPTTSQYRPAVARPPDRKRRVFFLGAGFSCAAGLPNTAALLASVHSLAQDIPEWGVSKNIEQRLQSAYAYFYPDKGPGFRPEVVDFFSVLTAYNQIDRTGMPGGFPDRELLADLRFAIDHVLCEGLRVAEAAKLAAPHELLDRMVLPGNVVITTNWDSLVERTAEAREVPHRLSGHAADGELLILKLHGSIDWLRPSQAKKPVGRIAYAELTELCGSARAHRSSPTTASAVLRTRIPSAGATWRTIKRLSRKFDLRDSRVMVG